MVNRAPNLDPEDFDIIDLPAKDERSLARRIALQVLYEADSTRHPFAMVMARHLDERQPNERTRRYVVQLVEGVELSHERIDPIIHQLAPEFPLNQIAVVDRNILRIAVYEFAVSGITPVGVAIDEAVELAKLFGSDTTPGFVNGVLGALADHPDEIAELRGSPPLKPDEKGKSETS
jgi:N utilization substance protein B